MSLPRLFIQIKQVFIGDAASRLFSEAVIINFQLVIIRAGKSDFPALVIILLEQTVAPITNCLSSVLNLKSDELVASPMTHNVGPP